MAVHLENGLSTQGMTILMWTLVGVCVVLTVGRYAIRYQVRRKFYWDDFAHLIGLISLIAFISLVQRIFKPAELVMHPPPGMPPPKAAVVSFRRHQLPLSIMAFICYWSVKFSYLFFYQLLFWISPIFRKAWYCVFTFVFVGFWVPIAANLTRCGSPKDLFDPVQCKLHVPYQRKAHLYILGVNVSTDLAVIILPLFMLHQVRIARMQKVALGFLFSIVFVTIALDILRTVESLPSGIFSQSILYGILEANFCIIISCVPTYRALLGIERRTKGNAYAHWNFSRSRTAANNSGTDVSPLKDSSSGSTHQEWAYAGKGNYGVHTGVEEIDLKPVASNPSMRK